MNAKAGQGHTGADLSQADILCTLFFNQMKYEQKELNNPQKDRFILSKGHGAGGYYCLLSLAGFISESELDTYLAFDSRLPGHPARQKLPGLVEINTGGLGHGLSISVGLALSKKLQKYEGRVYILTGDGELQEGSNWEALMCAAQFKLDNLVVIVDRNGLQLSDRTETIMSLEPIKEKLTSFGAEVYEAEGNSPEMLQNAFTLIDTSRSEKPKVLIAHTLKGKGVSFIEDKAPWHHKIPNQDELEQSLKELE